MCLPDSCPGSNIWLPSFVYEVLRPSWPPCVECYTDIQFSSVVISGNRSLFAYVEVPPAQTAESISWLAGGVDVIAWMVVMYSMELTVESFFCASQHVYYLPVTENYVDLVAL